VREFEEVYRADGVRLVAELHAITGSLAEAEDIVQEAFARAYARWRSVGAMDAPAAWIRRVALNLATSRWRARHRASRLAHRVATPDSVEPVLPDDAAGLITALQRLPVRQRIAIVLHYWADLPVAEIAEATGQPVATVKSHLRRARAALADELKADLADDSGVDEPSMNDRRGVSR
jgi:RNA polymerase sigma-70 factor (ECF subfamily)